MAKGFKHGTGGADLLNFKVKAYPSETEMKADKPVENTIGICTTTTISSWIFSATEPTEPKVGMVWFMEGTSGTTEFNALKNNGVMVYPKAAKQYVGGAWVEIPSMIYRGGEWIDLAVYLFNYGKQPYEWKPRGWKHSDPSQSEAIPTVTKNNDGSITFSISSASSAYIGSGCMELAEDFDLTHFKTLELECNYDPVLSSDVPNFYLVVVPRSATYWNSSLVCRAYSSAKGNQKLTLDVSNVTGTYDIAVMLYMNTYQNGTGSISCTMKTLKAI